MFNLVTGGFLGSEIGCADHRVKLGVPESLS